jgi:hypothetical protein
MNRQKIEENPYPSMRVVGINEELRKSLCPYADGEEQASAITATSSSHKRSYGHESKGC